MDDPWRVTKADVDAAANSYAWGSPGQSADDDMRDVLAQFAARLRTRMPRSVTKINGSWYAQPNGPGSVVGPYKTAEEAWEWMEQIRRSPEPEEGGGGP